jgi:hypothetical protein
MPDNLIPLHGFIDQKMARDPLFQGDWEQLHAGDYEPQSRIILNGGFAQRESVARCGQNCGMWVYDCDDRRLCARCCDLRGGELVKEFGGTFEQHGEIWFVTPSLSTKPSHWHRVNIYDRPGSEDGGERERESEVLSHVPFDPFFNHALMRLQIDTMQSFSRSGRNSRRQPIKGLVGRVEMSLRFDGELKTLPHGHYVFFADRVTKAGFNEVLQRFTERIGGFPMLHAWMKANGVYPCVHAKRIANSKGLGFALRYLVEPIDLVDPYRQAIAQLGAQGLLALNTSLKAFLAYVPLVFKKLNRVVALGSCTRNSKSYFGVKPPKRKAKAKAEENDTHSDSAPRVVLNEQDMARQFAGWEAELEERRFFCNYAESLKRLRQSLIRSEIEGRQQRFHE